MTVIDIANAGKSFTMHLQGGLRLPVVHGVSFKVASGECVVLAGPSGCGKSSVLKMIFGSYRCGEGHIRIRTGNDAVDIATAEPRLILSLRRHDIGYVSQFLRAVPRVAAIDVVAEPLVMDGAPRQTARAKAGDLLGCLNIAPRLWGLPPATFSGGEQQRVNIARGFIADLPLLLLDEPTASLDAANRNVVVRLIEEKKARGTAIVGIFHDEDVRERVASRVVDVTRFQAKAA